MSLSGSCERYDVGFTSNFVSEIDALADLALEMGNSTLHTLLQSRAQHFRSLIALHLWDNETSIFTNKLQRNDKFYRRISPTSFYALGAGAATDAQAEVRCVYVHERHQRGNDVFMYTSGCHTAPASFVWLSTLVPRSLFFRPCSLSAANMAPCFLLTCHHV